MSRYKTKTIFLVEASWDYEGTEPILCFATEKQAEAYQSKCEAHILKKPQYANEKTDEECEKTQAKIDRWLARSPQGSKDYIEHCNDIVITQIKLVMD